MKNLELTQMELLNGGAPCTAQAVCSGIGLAASFVPPFAGGAAISVVCFFMPCDGESTWGKEWW